MIYGLLVGSIVGHSAESSKLFELARSVVHVQKDLHVERSSKKRVGEESDDEELGAGHVGPPQNDLYRKRQQKRVKS